jgi:hypothetical protein
MTGSNRAIDEIDASAVEAALAAFNKLRSAATYDPLIEEIKTGLAGTDPAPFEHALVKLGRLAGASSSVGDGGATAKPDASWDFSDAIWVTWEAKSDCKPAGEIDVNCIDQTNRHLRSMADRLGKAIPSGSVSILATPQARMHPTAQAIAEEHAHRVDLAFVRGLAARLDDAWRSIKTSMAPDSETERKRQTILEAFQSNKVLPTKWLTNIDRIRPPQP